jgi:hypothetical protein
MKMNLACGHTVRRPQVAASMQWPGGGSGPVNVIQYSIPTWQTYMYIIITRINTNTVTPAWKLD